MIYEELLKTARLVDVLAFAVAREDALRLAEEEAPETLRDSTAPTERPASAPVWESR